MTPITYAVLNGLAPPEVETSGQIVGKFDDFAHTVGYPMTVTTVSASGLPNASLLISLPSPFAPPGEKNHLASRLARSEIFGPAVLAGPLDEHQHLTSLTPEWIDKVWALAQEASQ